MTKAARELWRSNVCRGAEVGDGAEDNDRNADAHPEAGNREDRPAHESGMSGSLEGAPLSSQSSPSSSLIELSSDSEGEDCMVMTGRGNNQQRR